MLTQMIQRFKKIWHGQGLVQLARLHDQGVADPVINYMQQTYLEAVRWEQNLADWNTREMWGDHRRSVKKQTAGRKPSLKIRRLVRRMNHDIGKTIFSVGSFMCSYTRNKRVRQSRGSGDCAARNPTGAIDCGTVAATGGTHRVVPGRARCRDSGSLYLPHPDCRSGALVATEFQSQGGAIGRRGG